MKGEKFEENNVVYTTDGNILTEIQVYDEDVKAITIPKFTPAGKAIKQIGIDGTPVIGYSEAINFDLFIPDTVEYIAIAAFKYDENVKRVIIPNSVKKIGAHAFRSSDIEEINWPDFCDTVPSGCLMCTECLKKFKGGKNLKYIHPLAFTASFVKEIDLSETCVEDIPALYVYFSDVKVIPPYYFSGVIATEGNYSSGFIED